MDISDDDERASEERPGGLGPTQNKRSSAISILKSFTHPTIATHIIYTNGLEFEKAFSDQTRQRLLA